MWDISVATYSVHIDSQRVSEPSLVPYKLLVWAHSQVLHTKDPGNGGTPGAWYRTLYLYCVCAGCRYSKHVRVGECCRFQDD